MRVFLLRHAIAEDRREFAKTGKTDDERPLTERGRERLKKSLLGLQKLMPPVQLILTSPYLRALHTAEAVAQAMGSEVVKLGALEPTNSPSEVLSHLQRLNEQEVEEVMIVGHEPHLNRLVTWLTMGTPAEILLFKKSGVCCLEFKESVDKGCAEIVWFLGPSQLIAIGRS